MAIKTYFWNQRNVSFLKYVRNRMLNKEHHYFRYGNAGDMFNVDLIKKIYNTNAVNSYDEAGRLFLIGSVMNRVKKGDIINGIGWKGNDLSIKEDILESLEIFGVRGPLTKSLFEKYNSNLTNLKFEYDPGLLIKEVYDIDLKNSREEQAIFIPHFRDESVYNKNYPKSIKHVSVDAKPYSIAKEILKSKVVYSSSLHGIIFAHALGKPCVFVKPQSNEPIFKFRDYYLSIGKEMPEPLKSIYDINFLTNIEVTMDYTVGLDDFYFPSIEFLNARNIIV